MDQDLRELFDRALDDEPPPPDDLARMAMAQGVRLRRRRNLIAGGGAGAAVAAVVTALTLSLTGGPGAAPPVGSSATCAEPRLYLRQAATRQQVEQLNAAIIADQRTGSVDYESREQAYERFKVLWRDSPDKVQAVNQDGFPASYGIELKDPSTYRSFVEKFQGMPAVERVGGDACPAGAGHGRGK